MNSINAVRTLAVACNQAAMPDPVLDIVPVAISAAALLVSLLSLGVSFHVARRDRANVRVSFSCGNIHWGNKTIDRLVVMKAANRGRRPVVLSAYGFALSNREMLTPIPFPAFPLPKKLEEGESYTNYVALRTFQETVQELPKSVRVTAFVFKTADGREYRQRIPRWSKWHRTLQGSLVPLSQNIDLLDPTKPLRELHLSS